MPLAINWLLLELKRRLVEKVVGLLREQEMRDRECEWDQKKLFPFLFEGKKCGEIFVQGCVLRSVAPNRHLALEQIK